MTNVTLLRIVFDDYFKKKLLCTYMLLNISKKPFKN